MRQIFTGLLTAATIGFSTLALTGAASAAPFSHAAPALADRAGTSALVDHVQYVVRPGYGRRYGGPRYVARQGYYGRPDYYGRPGYARGGYRRGVATAVGVGAAAAIVGGLIASQQPVYAPAPVYVEPRTIYVDGGSASCARRFRSYNPSTGTYVGYDGIERFCP